MHSTDATLCSDEPNPRACLSITLKLSVGRTCPVYLLEIEGLLTQGWRPGRTFG